MPEPERRLRVLAVAIGASHECALSEEGVVWCRGRGAHGELGRASTVPAPRFIRVPGLERVVSIAAGARHTCALLASEEVQCWGDNGGGQLGDGTVNDRGWPVAVLRGPGLGERLAAR